MYKLFKRKQKENIDAKHLDDMYRAFGKVQRCIRSSKTQNQVYVCNNLIKNFNILFNDIKTSKELTNELYIEISNAIIENKSMLFGIRLYDTYNVKINGEKFVRKI